jgi:hypothetical protein
MTTMALGGVSGTQDCVKSVMFPDVFNVFVLWFKPKVLQNEVRILIEIFVFWIEWGHDKIEDFHGFVFYNSTMSYSGWNEDGHAGVNGVQFTIELHLACAFEKIIDFGMVFVVVGLSVFADGNGVEGTGV